MGIKATNNNELRKAVYRRDNYQCALCGDNRRLQIHHYVRRSQGGKTVEQNMITLCMNCHALAHGVDLRGLRELDEENFKAEAVELAMVEYLSDLYAQQGLIWDPWSEVRLGKWGWGPKELPF